MSELTPEGLRSLADDLLKLHDAGLDRDFVPTEEWDVEREAANSKIHSYADAWEQQVFNLKLAYAQLADEAVALQRRVEELDGHKHTDECLEYAAKTGRAFCIAECADSRVLPEFRVPPYPLRQPDEV